MCTHVQSCVVINEVPSFECSHVQSCVVIDEVPSFECVQIPIGALQLFSVPARPVLHGPQPPMSCTAMYRNLPCHVLQCTVTAHVLYCDLPQLPM